jgi:hypothetical protein
VPGKNASPATDPRRSQTLTAALTAPQPLTTTAPRHVRLDAGQADSAALNNIVSDGAWFRSRVLTAVGRGF